jgi:hypothetical protein
MPHRNHFLTHLRAVFNHLLGCGCAVLVAFGSSTATADELSDVRIAFQDEKAEVATPPAQPGPAPTHVNNSATLAGDSLSAPTHCESHHHMQHCCPPPAYTRWPIIGPLHRRWITYTKPHMQASHWGYPEYFEERPYGSYVLQAEQMQVYNGLRDQQVLYNYDFVIGTAELKPRGEYELQKIIRRMETVPCPIIIQSVDVNNPNPELDEARRQSVLEALRKAGVPASDELVVTNRPPLPGLQGVEGSIIYGNMLGQTEERGGGFDYRDDFGGGAPQAIFIGGGIGFTPSR